MRSAGWLLLVGINDNKITLALRPRNLDSGYLSNERLNPAVIRCNIEPAASHLVIC